MSARFDKVMLLPFALASVLALILTHSNLWEQWPSKPGIDYYQLWGIAKAQRASGLHLGTPYLDRDGYQQQLRQLAASTGDARLAAALSARAEPDPTGTPLIYYLMGALPSPYAASLWRYRVLEFLAFAGAVVLLAAKGQRLAQLALALPLTCGFVPLLFELGVANINSLQLLGLVLTTAALAARPGRITAMALAALLVFQTMLKPNFASATGLLWICLLLSSTSGYRGILLSTAATAAMLFVLPCTLFHSWSAWSDWWHYSFSSAARIAYPVSEGNYSPVAYLSETLKLSTAQAMLVCGLGLLWPLPWMRHSIKLIDPWFCLCAGIVLAFALSPLVWQHYQVLAVAPCLWLCRMDSAPQRVTGWGCLFLYAESLDVLNAAAGRNIVPEELLGIVHAFGWAPLWAAIMLAPEPRPFTAIQTV